MFLLLLLLLLLLFSNQLCYQFCFVKNQLARLHLTQKFSPPKDLLCFAFLKFKMMTGGTITMATCPLFQALFHKS